MPYLMSDIIILGGGLAGLSVADHLLKNGHTVTILEKVLFLEVLLLVLKLKMN